MLVKASPWPTGSRKERTAGNPALLRQAAVINPAVAAAARAEHGRPGSSAVAVCCSCLHQLTLGCCTPAATLLLLLQRGPAPVGVARQLAQLSNRRGVAYSAPLLAVTQGGVKDAHVVGVVDAVGHILGTLTHRHRLRRWAPGKHRLRAWAEWRRRRQAAGGAPRPGLGAGPDGLFACNSDLIALPLCWKRAGGRTCRPHLRLHDRSAAGAAPSGHPAPKEGMGAHAAGHGDRAGR